MNRPLVIGIDPGLSGAIAIYDASTKKLVFVEDMPLIDHEKNAVRLRKPSPQRRQIDPYTLALIIDAYAKSTALAVIEDVHAGTYTDGTGNVRGQGAAASFAFGKASGLVIGACASSMIPMAHVKPAVWKQLMGLSHDKNLSRQRASELFPDFSCHWRRAKDDGRAEAALLSFFGAERLMTGMGVK